MKRIYIYVLMALAAAAAVSCVEEKIGMENVASDTYGVYFPSQKNTGHIEFTPIGKEGEDGKVVTSYTKSFEINRLKPEGEIVVPLTVLPDDGTFTCSEVKFTEGQTKTSFVVTLSPDAELGRTYKCSISVDDPSYADAYSQYDAGIDFSVIVVEWKRLVGGGGEQYGRYRDDCLTAAYMGINTTEWKSKENTEVIFEERTDKPGYFRLTDVYSGKFWGPNGGIAVEDAEKYFMNPKIIIDATDPDKVVFPYQGIGMDYGYGEIGICSLVSEYMDDFVEGFEPSDSRYGTFDKETGIIEFPVEGLLVLEGGYPYIYGNPNGLFRIVLPGFNPIDYGVTLKAGYSENGTVRVDYSFGYNVRRIKYAVYPGVLTEDLAKARARLIDEDAAAPAALETEGTLEISSLEKTGVYTLVTANYGEDGVMADYSFVEFSYIMSGEDVPVEVTPELIATDRNSALGFTAENSLELYVRGKDIVQAYLLVVRGDQSAAAKDELIEKFFTKNILTGQIRPLDDESLGRLNGGGLSDIFYGLTPGHAYTVMVYADNGYRKDIIIAVGRTKGEYSIVNDSFYYDPDPELSTIKAVENPEELEGEYDFYAVDLMKSGNQREKIGTVSITVETGLNSAGTAHVPVGIWAKGLTGSGAAEAGLEDDSMYFPFMAEEEGTGSFIASCPNTYSKWDPAEQDYVPVCYLQDGMIELPLGPGCIGSYSDGTPLYCMWVADPESDALLYGGYVEGLDNTRAIAFGSSYAYYRTYGLSFSGLGLFGWDSTYYLEPMRIFSAYDSLLLVPKSQDETAAVRFEKSYRMR